MTNIMTSLRPHITANNNKSVFYGKTLVVIVKYWPGVRFCERFYQINKAAGLDRFFRHVGTVVQKYKGLCLIIAVWVINYFTTYKILNACMSVASDSCKHHTTNYFEKLLKEKNGSDNISMITTLILVKIGMYIG